MAPKRSFLYVFFVDGWWCYWGRLRESGFEEEYSEETGAWFVDWDGIIDFSFLDDVQSSDVCFLWDFDRLKRLFSVVQAENN